MLARVFMLTGGKLPLIGVGGIDSGETALTKIEAGASLLQLYTGLVFEGPSLIGRIKQALVQAIEQASTTSLAPLIGRRADVWSARTLPARGAPKLRGCGESASMRSLFLPRPISRIRRMRATPGTR